MAGKKISLSMRRRVCTTKKLRRHDPEGTPFSESFAIDGAAAVNSSHYRAANLRYPAPNAPNRPLATSSRLAGSGVTVVGCGFATPTLNPVSVCVISLLPLKNVAEIAPAAVPVRLSVNPDPIVNNGTPAASNPPLFIANPVTSLFAVSITKLPIDRKVDPCVNVNPPLWSMIAFPPFVLPPVIGNVATAPDRVAGAIAEGTRELLVNRLMKPGSSVTRVWPPLIVSQKARGAITATTASSNTKRFIT
jgi:hypothetical protein